MLPSVDSHRDSLVHGRAAARVGDLASGERGASVGAITQTGYEVIIILGVGFGIYVLFGSILPALFGAAAKTRHSYKSLRGQDSGYRHERREGHTPSDWNEYVEGARKSRSSVIDAEFEPYHDTSLIRR
jgi:hypothetical protein